MNNEQTTLDERRAILLALEQITQRLDRLETRLEPIERLAHELPAVVGTVGDSLDGLARAHGEEAVDARLRGGVALFLQLSEPANLERLERLVGLLPRLLELSAAAEGLPGHLALVVDTLDGWGQRLADAGIDLHARGQTLLKVAERLTAPEALQVVKKLLAHLDSIEALLDSGVLKPAAVQVVARAGLALVEDRSSAPERMGTFALLRSLGDIEIQRSLAFAVRFARRFGRALDPSSH